MQYDFFLARLHDKLNLTVGSRKDLEFLQYIFVVKQGSDKKNMNMCI